VESLISKRIKSFNMAKRKGVLTVGLTGKSGG